MDPPDPPGHDPETRLPDLSIECEACRSALETAGDRTVSFLLIDQLTIPVVGCEDHLAEFRSICGLTTEDSTALLGYLPAGGIRCPSCRLAPYSVSTSLIPVETGAVAILACDEHVLELKDRFESGVEATRQLTASLDTPS